MGKVKNNAKQKLFMKEKICSYEGKLIKVKRREKQLTKQIVQKRKKIQK